MNSPERQSGTRRTGLTGTVIRGVTYSGGGFLLARGITLGTYIVLARLVTPVELGQFTAGSILVGIGLLFAGSGMSAAVIHRRDRLEEAAATAVVATILAGIVISLIALASSPLIGLFFDSSTVTSVAAAMAGVLLLQSARTVPNALLQRRFSFLRRLVVEPVSAVAFSVAAIVATSSGLGVWGLVVGQYASVVTDLVLTWVLARWRPDLRLASVATWRELIVYARHVLAGSAVRRIGDRIPIAAAGGFVGTAALGQFQYANRLVSTPFAFLVAGVSYVVFPAFSRISDDAKRFEPAFLRALRWMVTAAMPIGFVLLALGEPLAVLVFGERWAEAGEATRALAFFIPAQAVAQVIGEGFKGSGRPPERTWVNIVGVVAGVLTMVALIPPLGLIGVAIGVSVDAIASAGFSIRRAHRGMGIPLRPMFGAIVPQLVAALAMVAVLLPLETLVLDAASHGTRVGLALLALEGAIGLAIYVAALLVLRPGLVAEFRTLVSSARRSGGPEPETSDHPKPSDA